MMFYALGREGVAVCWGGWTPCWDVAAEEALAKVTEDDTQVDDRPSDPPSPIDLLNDRQTERPPDRQTDRPSDLPPNRPTY